MMIRISLVLLSLSILVPLSAQSPEQNCWGLLSERAATTQVNRANSKITEGVRKSIQNKALGSKIVVHVLAALNDVNQMDPRKSQESTLESLVKDLERNYSSRGMKITAIEKLSENFIRFSVETSKEILFDFAQENSIVRIGIKPFGKSDALKLEAALKNTPAVPKRYLIVVDSSANINDIKAEIEKAGAKVINVMDPIGIIVVECDEQKAKELKKIPGVESVELDGIEEAI